MILPSKHLSQERALLSVGAKVLECLAKPRTVSAVWVELTRKNEMSNGPTTPFGFDGYVLALDLLFLLGAIELQDGLLTRKQP
jgi:hypothetical protein